MEMDDEKLLNEIFVSIRNKLKSNLRKKKYRSKPSEIGQPGNVWKCKKCNKFKLDNDLSFFDHLFCKFWLRPIGISYDEGPWDRG